MQYQSLIRLFKHTGIDYAQIDAHRTKRILTAEFAASENGIITIDGFTYTKNDVLQAFENQDIETNINHDNFIWQHKFLLDCLERNTVNIQKFAEWDKLLLKLKKDETGLVNYVSPYFAVAFNNVMRKFLYPANFAHAATWMKSLALTNNTEDKITALNCTKNFIEDFVKELRNVNEVTYLEILPSLKTWSSAPSPWYKLINRLPDFMNPLKSELLVTLVNFTVVIQKRDPALCYNLSLRMVKVTGLDSDTAQIIQDNHNVFLQNQGIDDGNTKGSSGSNRKTIIWTIFIILFIIRICLKLLKYA